MGARTLYAPTVARGPTIRRTSNWATVIDACVILVTKICAGHTSGLTRKKVESGNGSEVGSKGNPASALQALPHGWLALDATRGVVLSSPRDRKDPALSINKRRNMECASVAGIFFVGCIIGAICIAIGTWSAGR